MPDPIVTIDLKTISNSLQDDKNYYGKKGQEYLSNSDISVLLNDPKNFRKPQEDNKNFLLGRFFHTLLLEPEKESQFVCIDTVSRNSKIYKEALEREKKEVLLLCKEADEVKQMANAIKQNISFYDNIYATLNRFEVAKVGYVKDTLWKGKADVVGVDFIIDLKTTSNIKDFKWSARKYNYDSQCYIYQTLFDKPLVFYVIDKTNYNLGIFEPSQKFIAEGEEKVEKAIEMYNRFYGGSSNEDVLNYYIQEQL